LLAVSAGLDSAVMAELFRRAGHAYGIAHCNFGLRGDESDADEQFVKEMAGRLGVPFFSTHFPTAEYVKQHRVSIQVAARELRYEWFEKIRSENDYTCIATAHHMQDAAETILLNFVKGTGLAGLHGISEKKGSLIRPLMFATREGIVEFAALNNILFREDSSNLEIKYDRNRIRRLVIPVLKEINPSLERTFYENAERIKGYETIIAGMIRQLKDKLFDHSNRGIIKIPIAGLRELHPLNTYLFELLRPFGFPNEMIAGIIESFDSAPGRQFFSPTHRLVKDRDNLLISERENNFTEFEIREEQVEEGMLRKYSHLISFEKHAAEGFPLVHPEDTACLDFHRLEFPLVVRTWRNGDFFYPLGMKGKKKLSDYFTDKKLSLIEKDRCWIVESGGKIAWVVGHRIDERFKIGPGSSEVFTIRISNEEVSG
jgi:tRNA(Ile)-lysidine synthase